MKHAFLIVFAPFLGLAQGIDPLLPALSAPYATDIHLRLPGSDHAEIARGLYSAVRDRDLASALAPRLVARLLETDPESATSLALSVSDRKYRAAACGHVVEFWDSRDRARAVQTLSDCARTGAIPTDALRRVLPRWFRDDPDSVRALVSALVAGITPDNDESDIDVLMEVAINLDPVDPSLPALIVQSLTSALSKAHDRGDMVLLAKDGRGGWLTQSTSSSLLMRMAWMLRREQPDLFERVKSNFGRWSNPPKEVEFVRRLRDETAEERELWGEIDGMSYDEVIDALKEVESATVRMEMLAHLLDRRDFLPLERQRITQRFLDAASRSDRRLRVLDAMQRVAEIRLNEDDPSVLRAWADSLRRTCMPNGVPACFDAYGDFVRIAPSYPASGDTYMELRQMLGN